VYQIISQAQHTVLLQTPYLVMSRMARQTFRGIQKREQPVRVWVSTIAGVHRRVRLCAVA
jgi:hypothetical protein